MTTVYVVRIFVNKDQEFGSEVGIVVDESKSLSSTRRLGITKQLGLSETVFVNQLDPCDLSIYSQQGEIKFASPLLGAVWFVEQQLGKLIDCFTCQETKVKVIHEDGITWMVVSDLSIFPPWNIEQREKAEEIEALSIEDFSDQSHSLVWAWVDSSLRIGKVRARTFAPGWGIAEEEANGSGSMLLAHQLRRNLIIQHGEGSVIRVSSGSTGVAVGGLVKQDRVTKKLVES